MKHVTTISWKGGTHLPDRVKIKEFPPPKLIDLHKRSASIFLKLLKHCRSREIALILGAGVSVSAQLPAWNKLLKRICSAFFYHWEYLQDGKRATIEKPPTNLSIAFAHEFFWSDEAIETAETFANKDFLMAAQQIKNCIRDLDWNWLLRRSLYDDENGFRHNGQPSPLIETICDICSAEKINIKSVITYNYDDLLERCLESRVVKYTVVYSGSNKPKNDMLNMYHPHGFLPLDGGPADTSFVLAEADYHHSMTDPYHWSNLMQLQTFSTCSCIFIGCSMTDPALRRLLRLANTTSINEHFAFLPSTIPNIKQNAMFDTLFDHDLLNLGVNTVRYQLLDGEPEEHQKLYSLLELLVQSSEDQDAVWR